MLRTIAAVLLVLWLIGVVGFSQVVGSFIHILIVLAIVMFVIDLISGGRATTV